MKPELILGTRASPLALAQTKIVVRHLREKESDLKILVKKIKTLGDIRRKKQDLNRKDLFTSEIDRALLDGEIDVAVHSLKDIPFGNMPREIEIAAFPRRDSPYDALISRNREKLRDLPLGATVGTSSARRSIQLLSNRPDLNLADIHGNIETRILKLKNGSGKLDAIVLACAGLNRLGLESEIDQIFPTSIMLPAVGQGCLAVCVRGDDKFSREAISQIDHATTRCSATAEISFSKEFGGDCNEPIAALARVVNNKLLLEGLVQDHSGRRNAAGVVVRSSILGSISKPKMLGKELARKLMVG